MKYQSVLFASGLLCSGILPCNAQVVQYLSIDDAIRQALEVNPEVQVARMDPLIERERLTIAESAFDWGFRTSYLWEDIDRPQNTQEFVATGGGFDGETLNSPRIFEELNHRADAALTRTLQTGTAFELGTSFYALDNTLNRQIPPSLFNPEWGSFSGLTFTHPLMRGAGRAVNTAEIRVAKSNSVLADLEWESQLSTVVGNVMKRYYDLVFAQRNMEVAQDSVALAETLVENNRQRETEGLATRMDILEAEVAVSSRQEDALVAQSFYVERQNALRLLTQREDEAAREMRVLPVSGLENYVSIPARDELIATGWEERPEVRQAEELIQQREIRGEFARNQLKPKLDLQGSAGLHGLDGDIGTSYGRAVRGQGPEWSLGFLFSAPLERREARSQIAIASMETRKAELGLTQQRTTVALEVDTVLSRVTSNRQRVETARKSRELAEESLQGEMDRYEEGKTTNFKVLEFQEKVSEARTREVAATADLSKAYVDLWLVSGLLLERQNIILENQSPADAVVVADWKDSVLEEPIVIEEASVEDHVPPAVVELIESDDNKPLSGLRGLFSRKETPVAMGEAVTVVTEEQPVLVEPVIVNEATAQPVEAETAPAGEPVAEVGPVEDGEVAPVEKRGLLGRIGFGARQNDGK